MYIKRIFGLINGHCFHNFDCNKAITSWKTRHVKQSFLVCSACAVEWGWFDEHHVSIHIFIGFK